MYPSGQSQRGAGGEKPPARTDIVITQDVQDVLAMGGRVNIANISVECTNGVVKLDGVAQSQQERALAEDIARGVAGVTDVINRIVVVGETTAAKGRDIGKAISHNEPSEP